jgi:folate-dependent phosphoribosylglycinamide formyltransferase PurN
MSERVAILASGDRKSGGGGSTAEKVVRDVLEKKVGFAVGAVICNNPEGTVGVYDKINNLNRKFGLKGDNKIPIVTIDHADYPEQTGDPDRGLRLRESEAYCRVLENYGIDFVSMLGFMQILNGELIERHGWKPEYADWDRSTNGIYHPDANIMNNHPSILPWTADTHGHGAHQKAIDLFKTDRITHTAMTYHLASKGVDTGPIVLAEPITILPEDTADSLSDSVQSAEKELTAEVIDHHLIWKRQHLLNNPDSL